MFSFLNSFLSGLGLLLLLFFIYYYVTKGFNTFKDQGVPYLKGSFPFGSINAKKCLTGIQCFLEPLRICSFFLNSLSSFNPNHIGVKFALIVLGGGCYFGSCLCFALPISHILICSFFILNRNFMSCVKLAVSNRNFVFIKVVLREH